MRMGNAPFPPHNHPQRILHPYRQDAMRPACHWYHRVPPGSGATNDKLEVATFREVCRHGVVEGMPCLVENL